MAAAKQSAQDVGPLKRWAIVSSDGSTHDDPTLTLRSSLAGASSLVHGIGRSTWSAIVFGLLIAAFSLLPLTVLALGTPLRQLLRGCTMNITIELVGRGSNPYRVLLDDGWSLAKGKSTITATHPDVRDATAARNRLNRLHLLTSSALRIEFDERN